MCEYAQKAKPDGLLLGRDPAVLCEEPHVLGVFVSEARAAHARPRGREPGTKTQPQAHMYTCINLYNIDRSDDCILEAHSSMAIIKTRSYLYIRVHRTTTLTFFFSPASDESRSEEKVPPGHQG